MQFSQTSHNKYFKKIECRNDILEDEINVFQGITDAFDQRQSYSHRASLSDAKHMDNEIEEGNLDN